MQTVISSETQQDPILAKAYENFVDFMMNESEIIEDAYASRLGLSAWYKAYLSSKEFTGLSEDEKRESFELYENVLSFFKIASDYGMGIDEKEREIFGKKKFR